MDASSNVYAGGLSFSPLVAASGGSIFDPAGGLHFDIPLAAIQAHTNNALAFTASTNKQNQGFLARVLGTNAALVSKAGADSTSTNAAALSAAYGVGLANVNLGYQISNNTLDASKYAIQQQSWQVQQQQSGATKRKFLGGLFGGIFG